MPTTMPAVVKHGPGEAGVALREVPVPVPRTGQVLLRVVAAGVCGTDLHIARDEYRHEAPVVMGHELLAEVEDVGGEVSTEWVGARVVCETYFSTCGSCPLCRAGRPNLCPSRRSIGSFADGGFAPRLALPVGNLHRIEQGGIGAVLAEPLACAAQCLCDPAVVNPGDEVLVLGPGAMGQLSAQIARAQGGTVTLAGLPEDAHRLQIAAGLGLQTLASTPPAESFDVVIEATGSGGGARAALAAARRGGRYVQVGIIGQETPLNLDAVLYKELTLTSGFASTPQSWRRALALISAGQVRLEPLVTSRYPLSQWSAAFQAVRTGEGVKTILEPEASPAPGVLA
ncbi:zinc-dependent alcohol dehydrogenase [Ruania zhangjianzhongii]|uniref:zinc-dependent alcohol dehydrogenase n=1 Tax=Ruania zhangjianzhongii TaxID=2603206 RepID=UPI001AEFFB00|nr:alcohol dehydrogenase catalytic domain-containing protein [Ruania zhangjianzhongii]